MRLLASGKSLTYFSEVGCATQSATKGKHHLVTGLQFLGSALLLALWIGISGAQAQNVQFLPTINPVAGNGIAGYSGDGGSALNASIAAGPTLATTDASGNIYISDSGNNVIRRVDAATGIITTVVGGAATVCADATDAIGDGCPATQATLNDPLSVRFYKGDMYIVDNGDNYIRMVSGTTGLISIYAGNGKKQAPTPGNKATKSAFKSPQDIAFDAAGDLFIASTGSLPYVSRVDAVTQVVSIVAGTGTSGDTGNGGLGTAAEVADPEGLAVDAQGNVYISGRADDTVRKVTIPAGATTGIITNYAGAAGTAGFAGDGTTADNALLSAPKRIYVDPSGNLYIADTGNNRIRMVAPPAAGAAYGIINTVVGDGTPAEAGDGGPAASASLNAPLDVELNPAGDMIITDSGNNLIREIRPTDNFPATAVGSTTTQTVYAQINTALTVGSFSVPTLYPDFTAGTPTSCTAGSAVPADTVCSLTVTFQPTLAGTRQASLLLKDSTGNVYAASLYGIGNAPAAALFPGTIETIAGTGTAGNSGDSAIATGALLNTPLAEAIDGQGNLFFADSANNEVREIAASSGVITRVAGTGMSGFSGDGGAATSATLSAPSGVAVDGADNLYISDTGNNRIRFVSAATGTISTFAGTGVAGYSGDGGVAGAAQLTAPSGLALSPLGVLYVADTGNNVIRTIGLRSNGISTFAGNGTAGFGGDGGPAAAANAQLNAPTAVAVDNNGAVYIADTGNQRIREIANGTISTLAGTGTAGFSGDGSTSTAELNNPTGLAVDAAADVYVADTGNNLVRRIAGGQITTIAGTGTQGYTGDGGSSIAATLNAPQGVALDGSGNLLLADSSNNVIRKVSVSQSALTFPETSPGTTSATQTVSILNNGNLPLDVSNVSIPAEFSEVASGAVDCNGTAVSVAAGSACDLSLVFSPATAGSYSDDVVATDNSQNVSSSTQTVAVSGASDYVYAASLTLPATAVAGDNLMATVSVSNPASAYTGTVHFSSSDPQAVLPADYTYTIADAGSHVFTIQLRTSGIQTVTVTDTTTATITATTSVTVTGASATTLAIVSGNSQSTDISTAFAEPLVVEALDVYGNPSPGTSVTFTAPATGATATWAGSTTATVTSDPLGLATSPALTADGVTGAFTVQAGATGVATPVQFALTNTSSVPAGFTFTSNPSSINSLPPGTKSTVTVTATPVGGFDAPIDLTCTGAPKTTSCQLSTTTLTPNGLGGPTSFQVTIQTTGPAQASRLLKGRTAIYACFLLLPLGLGFSKKKKLRPIVLALLVFAGIAGMTGCGSGSTSTQVGTFTVTVTGTSGSLTNSTTITCYVAGIS